MEELYFVNGRTKTKKGMSWVELLQWCYNQINTDTGKRIWSNRYGYYDKPHVKAYDHIRFREFFNDYRHHNNDFSYWSKGQYERIFIGFDEERKEKIYENGEWIPPKYIVPEKGWYIEDTYKRIIPSACILVALREFKPSIAKESTRRYNYGWYNVLYDHDRDFRKGPLPGRGGYRNSCGRRYAGDHGNSVREIKYRPGYEQIQKETREEYGITFSLSRRNLVDLDACCYHFRHHGGGKGHGWKRTRKEKQWM